MKTHIPERIVLPLLCAAFAVIIFWGYASDSWQKVFTHDPQTLEARRQQALDHTLGADIAFDSSADDVTKLAAGTGDTLSWKILAHAKIIMGKGNAIFPEGVNYADDVKAFDGKQVTITGYMFPLQASSGQNHFLLSAYPPSCPYCLPGGPTELIDITGQSLPFTYDPVTLTGTLHLLAGDALKEGLFYRMTGAQKTVK